MRKLKAMVYAWISDRYMHDCSSYNTLAVRKSCRSKAQGREKFGRHGFPHAPGMVFVWPWQAHRFARKHGFPLVVKPNVSGYSRGSYFPIRSMGELYRAIFWAKIWWPTTVIEKYLLGANYRVLADRDRLISVIRRYPPFVTGDGRSAIDELIDEENRVRAEMQLHPTIFPIGKSKKVAKHLRKQGLCWASVPQNGRQVELFHRVALSTGGVVETIDRSQIPEINRLFFTEVVRSFDANVFGVDVIFERGIEHPYTEQDCILIEVNSRPYIKMHHYPRYGKKEDFSEALARLDALDIPDRDIF
ncbi:MAG: cyanophycin synthetase [Gammaproteobacteria bacterium]|nr:cyanophycin synthetase [Gammaproteobacteria bacterium]MYD76685.1 cyanophycin synthetase [Gammaproteobacteria bacterium]MYJ53140.1 cyanophycin synthetase [Gammaproteobacteria bacterium]